jgi:hypothetical protein
MSDGLVNLILGIVVVGRNPQDRGQVTAFSVDTGAGSRRYPDNKACPVIFRVISAGSSPCTVKLTMPH